MRAGDKLYCKRTRTEDDHIWVTKNKIYTIILDYDSNLCIVDDEKDENSVVLHEYFDIYFYTEQEHRKRKLEKINENRR